MRSLRTLEIVEGYFDEELTPELVAKLHDTPLAHFEGLDDLLAAERRAWREETSSEIIQGVGTSTDVDGSVLLLDDAAVNAKPFLLYAESLALLDPLDPAGIQPSEGPFGPISWQEEDEETQRSIWKHMLKRLAAIRPLLAGVQGLLLVCPGLRGSHLLPSPDDFIEQWCGPDLHRSLKDQAMYLEERAAVERQGELLALAGNIGHLPCTHDESTLDLLGSLNLPSAIRSDVPPSEIRALSVIAEYRIPELHDYDLQTLIALRRQDDAFFRFRSMLRQVLAMTQSQVRSLPNDFYIHRGGTEQDAVAREFRAQLDQHLRPELDRLQLALQSSTFYQHFLQTALPLTFGMVGVSYFGESLVATLLGAGASLSGSALAELAQRSRTSHESRRDRMLRTAYLGLGTGRASRSRSKSGKD